MMRSLATVMTFLATIVATNGVLHLDPSLVTRLERVGLDTQMREVVTLLESRNHEALKLYGLSGLDRHRLLSAWATAQNHHSEVVPLKMEAGELGDRSDAIMQRRAEVVKDRGSASPMIEGIGGDDSNCVEQLG